MFKVAHLCLNYSIDIAHSEIHDKEVCRNEQEISTIISHTKDNLGKNTLTKNLTPMEVD